MFRWRCRHPHDLPDLVLSAPNVVRNELQWSRTDLRVSPFGSWELKFGDGQAISALLKDAGKSLGSRDSIHGYGVKLVAA